MKREFVMTEWFDSTAERNELKQIAANIKNNVRERRRRENNHA